MTTKTKQYVGLWLDRIGGNDPKWIVDVAAVDADQGSSDTIAMFGEDEYAAARERAIAEGASRSLPVVEIDEHGRRTQIND